MFTIKKTALSLGLLCAQLGSLSLVSAAETAPGITDFKKPFNEYSWVTAHNGYLDDMRTQLNRGVRGFMLDLHPGNLTGGADAYLCHTGEKGTCDIRSDMKFADALNNVFLPYLRSNPNAVVTLLLENLVERAAFNNAMNRVPGLADWVFDPKAYPNTRTWPTLEQMIGSGKRLVIVTDRNAGEYNVNGKTINVLQDSQWESQNYWDLGITSLKHEWSCPSRWTNYHPTVSVTGFTQWPRLFVMNQFHGWGATSLHAGSTDNNLTWLERRVDNHCASALGKRTAPSFLTIDFNQTGDAFPYAAALTQGGFYFYSKNNVDKTGDSVCVVPAGQDLDFSLPARGCENDEARSLELRGIAKGTRLSVYDSSGGNTSDDYTFVDVKRDIGINESVKLGSFEANFESADIKVTHVRNNGLDGKISRISIGKSPAPGDFRDASVVFYEGNSATENVVCTVNLATTRTFNFSGDCDNDEARSAKVVKAKGGSSFMVYGNKNVNENQGYARVDFISDITTPVIIGSFERSYDAGAYRVIRGGPSNTLDGKVSSMRIMAK
ncbi:MULTISPECIES: hypothetical protein [Pseudomonas]|uniref:hypothetical protein n=1 Tax=Pseudomonas TaxID=286 RepID=UPI000A1FB530|nr:MULTISPECIES: hypothetical protein [Pseudomonas]MCX4219219.1 hypothetical protein [Pseudomonas sp. MCal1]UIN56035.1 hypothetical protein LXN51_06825 [Pseudomonas kribbensis]